MGSEGGEGGDSATAVHGDDTGVAAGVEQGLVVWAGYYVASVTAH